MKLKILFFAFAALSCIKTFGQISGNQAYSKGDYYPSRSAENIFMGVRTTDSSIVISARILYNVKPDYCMVTIGLNEEARTLSQSIEGINKRIKHITDKLGSIEVKKDDYYIDFISQTKVYDYKTDAKRTVAEEQETGMEVKKNLIVKIRNLSDIDKLVEIAAEAGAYDIIKVDYKNTNTEDIYTRLFNQCRDIIEKKKGLYFGDNAKIKFQGVVYDNFYSIPPATRYQSYQAYEAANLNTYQQNYPDGFIQKELRKSKTFFYNGVDASGFDKTLNPDDATVGSQYILELSIRYATR